MTWKKGVVIFVAVLLFVLACLLDRAILHDKTPIPYQEEGEAILFVREDDGEITEKTVTYEMEGNLHRYILKQNEDYMDGTLRVKGSSIMKKGYFFASEYSGAAVSDSGKENKRKSITVFNLKNLDGNFIIGINNSDQAELLVPGTDAADAAQRIRETAKQSESLQKWLEEQAFEF